MSAELATLAADPTRLEHVSPEEIPGLIGETEALKALLWARLQAASAPEAKTKQGQAHDRLLTVDDVAERLGVSRRWVYRKAKADALPFVKRLASNTLRFSERGLERWQARR